MGNFTGLQIRFFAILFLFASFCSADTFTNRQTGQKLHGFATLLFNDGKTLVHTEEKGVTELNLAEWNIVTDKNGRNNEVVILKINGPIKYEIETAAFEKAIEQAIYGGPLFLIVQIDTPGGRTDYAQRICGAISNTGGCPVLAFVKSDHFGGALSSGAAVALACNKIYMSENSTIGAAAAVSISTETLTETYGPETAEKFSSAWSAYFASLAEKNNRPAILARAMVDKNIEVVEILDSGKKVFMDSLNNPNQQAIRIWNKKDSLLTLTAKEAVDCRIADKMADSVDEVLRDLEVSDAKIQIDRTISEAASELKKANAQLERIIKSIDLKIKQAKEPMRTPKTLSALRNARSEFQILVKLAKRYPDLELNIRMLEEELNSIEANYQKIRIDANAK